MKQDNAMRIPFEELATARVVIDVAMDGFVSIHGTESPSIQVVTADWNRVAAPSIKRETSKSGPVYRISIPPVAPKTSARLSDHKSNVVMYVPSGIWVEPRVTEGGASVHAYELENVHMFAQMVRGHMETMLTLFDRSSGTITVFDGAGTAADFDIKTATNFAIMTHEDRLLKRDCVFVFGTPTDFNGVIRSDIKTWQPPFFDNQIRLADAIETPNRGPSPASNKSYEQYLDEVFRRPSQVESWPELDF